MLDISRQFVRQFNLFAFYEWFFLFFFLYQILMESIGYISVWFLRFESFKDLTFILVEGRKRSSQITFSLLFIVGVHRPWKTELYCVTWVMKREREMWFFLNDERLDILFNIFPTVPMVLKWNEKHVLRI